MHYKLPSYTSSHIAAFTGVLVLHGGLMAWQMMPTPPIAIPQQQIIQISMVAPSTPQPEQKPVVQQAQPQPVPDVPPAAEGMKKMQPKPEVQPEVKKPEPPEEEEVVQPQPPAPAVMTSGLQSPDSSLQHAAITEPVAADYLRNPPPVYPRNALRRKQQGTVMVEVRVSVQGAPLQVHIQRSSGHTALDDAAVKAVRKWRFVPARRGSDAVEANVVVPVEFRIN